MATQVSQQYYEDVFKELSELIDRVQQLDQGREGERLHDIAKERFTVFQELPHLLDRHIKDYVDRLLAIIRSADVPDHRLHLSFKFLHLLAKTRGYKRLIRHFPHEVDDVNFVLNLLQRQDVRSTANWETSYVLLLWLSLLLLIPLSIKRFDAAVGGDQPSRTSATIYDIVQSYLTTTQKAADAAAVTAANFFIREEIFELYTPKFVNWALQTIFEPQCSPSVQLNVTLSLAYLFKSGRRHNFQELGEKVLGRLIDSDLLQSPHEMVVKNVIKLSQRLALIFLRPRPATWRYQRGKRFLSAALTTNGNEHPIPNGQAATIPIDTDNHEDFEQYSEQLGNVIEMLLTGLRHDSTQVRWSSAKGVGRVAERLPQEMAEQVLGSILDLFSFGEKDSAWHGGCLTLAELGRRGLILERELERVVGVVRKALIYDELKGIYFSGAHVRDAACYITWAFARAYDAATMKPFIMQLASELVCVALYDREISCRRAAAAAFQEHVGRQGVFPHGIEIVSAMDYNEIGNRQRSFLEVALYVSSFEEYRHRLVTHLLANKLTHWDPEIRQLASSSLARILRDSPDAADQVEQQVLPKLSSYWSEVGLNQKHGAILGMASAVQVISVRKLVTSEHLLLLIEQLLQAVAEKKILRNIEADQFRTAYSQLIGQLCDPFAPRLSPKQASICLEFLQETLQNINPKVRQSAVDIVEGFYRAYLTNETQLATNFLNGLLINLGDSKEFVRCGSFQALNALPQLAFKDNQLANVFNRVIGYLKDDFKTGSILVEARAEAISCASNLLLKFDQPHEFLPSLYQNCILPGLSDYTETSKGDLGFKVRSPSVHCAKVVTVELQSREIPIPDDILTALLRSLVTLCLCQHEKLRSSALNCIQQLLHSGLQVSNVAKLRALLPKEDDQYVEPVEVMIAALNLDSYSSAAWQGITSSVGGKTLHIAKKAKTVLSKFLKSLRTEKEAYRKAIVAFYQVYLEQCNGQRLVVPLINTAAYLASIGHLDCLETEERKCILNTTYGLVKTSSDFVKTTSAGALLSNFLRFRDVSAIALGKIMVMLCNRTPKVRVELANAFNVALMTYGDQLFVDDRDGQDKCEQCIALLQTTQWNRPTTEIRPLRDQLCLLLGIPKPTLKVSTT